MLCFEVTVAEKRLHVVTIFVQAIDEQEARSAALAAYDQHCRGDCTYDPLGWENPFAWENWEYGDSDSEFDDMWVDESDDTADYEVVDGKLVHIENPPSGD
jgi:hypothetical protein